MANLVALYANTVSGKVVNVIRHGHTINGNPMMSVELNIDEIDGIPAESSSLVRIRIQNDAGLVYGIENSEYRDEPHAFALTRAGRISHVLR